jgi:hypothetical protein
VFKRIERGIGDFLLIEDVILVTMVVDGLLKFFNSGLGFRLGHTVSILT